MCGTSNCICLNSDGSAAVVCRISGRSKLNCAAREISNEISNEAQWSSNVTLNSPNEVNLLRDQTKVALNC